MGSSSHSANHAEEAKRKKYTGLSGDCDFEPFGFQTAGVFGANVEAFVTEVGHRTVLHTGHFLFQHEIDKHGLENTCS